MTALASDTTNGRIDLFAGTWGGVSFSTDMGATWAMSPLNVFSYVNALAVAPYDTSRTFIFAGTYYGVFLSTDHGATWNPASNGLTEDLGLMDLAVMNHGGVTTVFAGTHQGVFISTDHGSNWSLISSSPVDAGRLRVSGSEIYADAYSGIYRSTNYGGSWTYLNNFGSTYSLAVTSDGGEKIIFAGTDQGIYRSTNRGVTWAFLDASRKLGYVVALIAKGNGINTKLFAGTMGGVYLSTDNGGSWSAISNGMTNLSISFLVHTQDNLFAGSYYGGVFRSSDNGSSWINSDSGMTSPFVNCLAVSLDRSGSGYLFAGTRGGVFRSADKGLSWSAADSGLSSINVTSIAVVPAESGTGGNYLLAGTYSGGVFLSTNSGTNWRAVNNGLPQTRNGGGYLDEIKCIAVNDSNIFVGTATNGVYRSTNLGESWTAVNAGINNYNSVSSLVTVTHQGGTSIFAATWPRVFVSTNFGDSWTALNSGLPEQYVVRALAVSPDSSGYVFSGGYYNGSTGHGAVYTMKPSTSNVCGIGSWEPFLAGMPERQVSSIAMSDSNVFVGTHGAGVWRRPHSDLIYGDAYDPARRGIITGKIFNDENLNGLPDSAEESLPGRFITLSGKSQDFTTTDCDGRFTFTGLDAGTYVVREWRTPHPWITVSPAGGSYVMSRAVNDSSGYLYFGDYYPHGSIRGKVYEDLNANGIFDAGEKTVSGFTLTLSGSGTGSARSDSSGAFSFEHLPPGTYTVTLGARIPWIVSAPDSGSYSVTLGLNDTTSNDFGVFYPWCTISGKVFWDLNENGLCDSSESPLDHWLVRSSGTSLDSTFTDSLGRYVLYVDRGLRAVIPETPAGWEVIPLTHQGGDSITFQDYDKHESGHNFGLHPTPRRARIKLSVSDNTQYMIRNLFWGIRSGASSGIWGVDRRSTYIDYSEGESELPPRDFAVFMGLFDARFVAPLTPHRAFGEGSWTDMRNFDSLTQSTEYRIALLPGYSWGGNYPMTILWSQDSVAAYFQGPVTLDDESGFSVDMKTHSSIIITDTTIQFLRLIASHPNLVSVRPDRVAALPTEYRLFQNYPNPFNPVTTIRFDLPAGQAGVPVLGFVTLKVYDVLGQEVATLVDGVTEPGLKAVTWDAGNMPSGVYFYRMTAEKFTAVKKLLLVR